MDLTLHRLAKKATLRHLARGLYDYPRTDPDLGPLSPTTDAIVKALKGRDRILLQPSKAMPPTCWGSPIGCR